MKQFILKTILFLIVLFTIVELFSRLIIDPLYFFTLNTFDVRSDKAGFNEIYHFKKTEHVDYLFLGSSRVPSAVNPSLIMQNDPGKIAVVAGRGYMTEGITYQALKNRLEEFPGYLKGANVFLENSGSDIYSGSFKENKFRVYEPIIKDEKPMPQLLLPYLNFKNLIVFLNESRNSVSVKLDMVLLYLFSSYRTIPFIKEKFERLDDFIHFKKTKRHLASEGGIRNDNFENARKKAVEISAVQAKEIQDRPLLTFEDLDKSSLFYINELINKNGGKLCLFKIPLTSLQESVFNSDKALQNKRVFEKWISTKGITEVNNTQFHVQDSDFPDAWHLNVDRRDEFTLKLLDEFETSIHTLQ